MVVRQFGTLHAHVGEFRQNKSKRLVSRSANDPQNADAIVLVRRRHSSISAGYSACGPRMDVPATGIIHQGPGSLLRTGGEGRTPGPAPFAVATADKRRRSAPLGNAIGCTWTRFPPDSAAHPLRMRPCRDAGIRAMSGPGAGSQATKRTPGRGKGRKEPDMRGISIPCMAFRAARDRSNASRFAHDNFRYRA